MMESYKIRVVFLDILQVFDGILYTFAKRMQYSLFWHKNDPKNPATRGFLTKYWYALVLFL